MHEDEGVLEEGKIDQMSSSTFQPCSFIPVWIWGYSAVLGFSGVFGDSPRPDHQPS